MIDTGGGISIKHYSVRHNFGILAIYPLLGYLEID
jgi:hypothetical protein